MIGEHNGDGNGYTAKKKKQTSFMMISMADTPTLHTQGRVAARHAQSRDSESTRASRRQRCPAARTSRPREAAFHFPSFRPLGIRKFSWAGRGRTQKRQKRQQHHEHHRDCDGPDLVHGGPCVCGNEKGEGREGREGGA